jgi:hypothetical protein
MYEEAREMGLRIRAEVYGLFAAVLPQQAQEEIGKWPRRKRQGLVPDFLAAMPDEASSPSDATDELLELKTLHHGSTTYPVNAGERCSAVNRRARALPAEATAKARRLDQRFCGTAIGESGPVEQRLAAFGAVRGLVFGHWAEASDDVEVLLRGCARSGSERHWSSMRARNPDDACGTLRSLLRQRWGMTAWRATVRLVLDRLEHVGVGASNAQTRRRAAQERAAAVRRSAQWLYQRARHR